MIYIVDIESVPTRYTGEWATHIPKLLTEAGYDVQRITGPTDIPDATTPGAFLNFGGTNVFKASQVEQLGRLFCSGSIKPYDHFLFTDAWHPGIINLKYMSELLHIPIITHGLWHAGSYDPQDFLGRLIGDEPWVRHAEKSFFHSYTHNYFATNFHIDMFDQNLFQGMFGPTNSHNKIVRSGWPMEYMEDTLAPYKQLPKRDLILFPHRIAPEKQVEIFRDLAKELPQYEFVVCQDKQLTKAEYHTLLGQAKIVFSANLQETLGISTCAEGPLLNAIPVAPDRLSYSEIFKNHSKFLYPSIWTSDYDSYTTYKELLKLHIVDLMDNYELIAPTIGNYISSDYKLYFHASTLLKILND